MLLLFCTARAAQHSTALAPPPLRPRALARAAAALPPLRERPPGPAPGPGPGRGPSRGGSSPRSPRSLFFSFLLSQYIEQSGKVLRFYASWRDDRLFGKQHDLTLHYYLADGEAKLRLAGGRSLRASCRPSCSARYY